MVDVLLADASHAGLFASIAPHVFDGPVDMGLLERFLAEPNHHIAIAVDAGEIVGFASGVTYLHPDKPRELWVNELGVAPSYRRRGIGRAVLERLLAEGRKRGAALGWVLTEVDNAAARSLYEACGGRTLLPSIDDRPLLYEFSPAEVDAAPAEDEPATDPAPPVPYHPPVKRSIAIDGHRTSISLEPIFWNMLKAAAQHEGLPVSALVARIDAERIAAPTPPGLAGAIRVWLVSDKT
jgi:GNAT superfamily N-acetyltransferase